MDPDSCFHAAGDSISLFLCTIIIPLIAEEENRFGFEYGRPRHQRNCLPAVQPDLVMLVCGLNFSLDALSSSYQPPVQFNDAYVINIDYTPNPDDEAAGASRYGREHGPEALLMRRSRGVAGKQRIRPDPLDPVFHRSTQLFRSAARKV